MKKRVALAVGAVLMAGGLGACWYTGNVFDRILAEQIVRVKQESGLELSWHPTSENLFNRDGVLKVVLTPQTLASIDPQLAEGGPIETQFVVNSRLLPLSIKSHLLLDTSKGTLAPVFAALGLQQWQLGMETASSLWSMTNSSRFWAGEFKLSKDFDEFSFLPLAGDYRGDLAGNGHLNVLWQGMTLHAAHDGQDLVLADLKGSIDLAEISGVWLSPRSDMTLAAFSLTQPDTGSLSLRGLSSLTLLAGDDAQTLSSRYQMKVETLHLENESDSLALTDGNLNIELKGLDLEGYQALQEVGSQPVDEAAIMQAVDKLLARGARLQLTDLSARLNGEPVGVKGEGRLAPTSLAQLIGGKAEGEHALSGQFHAILGARLATAVPQLAPLLKQYGVQGYLKTEEAGLTAELKLDKGVITVNDLPLPR